MPTTVSVPAAWHQWLVEHAPVGMALVDRSGRIGALNDRLAAWLGGSTETLVGTPLSGHLCAEERARHDAVFGHVAAGRLPACTLDVKCDRSTSAPFWGRFSYTAAAAHDAHAPLVLVVEDVSEVRRLRFDVGERRKELALLHGMAGRLANAVDVDDDWLAALVSLVPPAFQWPAHTEAFVRVGAYTAQTAGWATRVHDNTPRLREVWRTANGDEGLVEVANAGPATDAPFLREEHALVASVADILGGAVDATHARTERARAQEALEATAVQLDAALESARVGIVDWDLITGHAQLSETACRFFRLPDHRARYPREALRNAIHPEDRESVRRTFELSGVSDASRYHEFRILHPDGTIIWIEAQGRIFYTDTGRPVRRLSILIDATERKQLEAEFRQAQKMEAMGRLAGGVAHDFNNLLTIVGAAAEILQDTLAAPSDAREELDAIASAVVRGRSLTQQLLSFSRRQSVRRVRVEFGALVQDMVPMLRRLVGAAVVLTVEPTDAPVPILADPHQIEQAIMNLVVNARQAMPRGGRLTLAISRASHPSAETGAMTLPDGDVALLAVTDSGVGMDAETQSKIFEPFFTTRGEHGGTGLGLATVFGIITQAGGAVSVTSAPDAGTMFRIALPLAPA